MERCIYSHNHFSWYQLTVYLCHQLLAFGMEGFFSVALMDVFMSLPIRYDILSFCSRQMAFNHENGFRYLQLEVIISKR